MNISLLMLMIIFNYFVKKWSKCRIGLMTSSINADSRIHIFAPRENCVSEWELMGVRHVSQLLKHVSGQMLTQQRLGAWWEDWETSQISRALEVWPDLNIFADIKLVGDISRIFVVRCLLDSKQTLLRCLSGSQFLKRSLTGHHRTSCK